MKDLSNHSLYAVFNCSFLQVLQNFKYVFSFLKFGFLNNFLLDIFIHGTSLDYEAAVI